MVLNAWYFESSSSKDSESNLKATPPIKGLFSILFSR